MKKIKYKFEDGEKELEVSDEFAAVYEQILKDEAKIERKETRRHSSLEELEEQGFQFSSGESDFIEVMEKEAREEKERLGEADDFYKKEIRREKRVLKKILTPRQFDAYFSHVYGRMKKVDIAKKMNITEGAVKKLIKKAEIKANDAYNKDLF